ncbi:MULTISPECIES: carbohydrate ABC transporter permease [Rhizobium]|uniref:Carbohydrate ABC transporter membrane protein 1, CUT1 family n=1 Tax=Rhizobium miluonense TaxID=411945 RepID=A0A1C3WF92_9HYPH|nr:sugar ABC transporter permease [Rhizobium miluonense]SCB21337.1 carbohydrate ABC transporter membrane protein 1, CUT1 family [Rhizobium miluonense]SCB38364.1 carbohydrate ABC transporter membrane protein 1, CUT1 family [Rhizobium miluonense]SCB48987.1 carbohydrate ABC transporter membrane protein 1, CUT1 family [Rhizobium miluonense]
MSTVVTTDPILTRPARRTAMRTRLQNALPQIVLAPSFLLTIIFVYGFIIWTGYLSFTNSKTFPSYGLTGARAYQRLWNWTFESDPPSSWYTSITNMGIFGVLYVGICLALGLLLAILLDQKIRGEGVLRPIFLYPMALSFIVTGVAWKWFLDPGLGLEQTLHQLGWTSFHFDWIKNKDFVIYTVVIAGVWQASGFVMAMFLAGLRGIDSEIMKAAQIDGASAVQLYRRIIIPLLRPIFLSAFIVLAHMAIKSYDLVVALTSGGPGGSAWLPSNFMYEYTFKRNEMAVGSASAIIMLMTISAIIVPYLYSELKEKAR